VITLASYIDHTILKPTTTLFDIEKICNEALEYGFAAVCVPPPFVAVAQAFGVRTATVIGFPFGYSAVAAKLAEIGQVIADGVDELDIVINLVLLKGGRWSELEEEMTALTARAHAAGKIVKVIIESGILSDEEIIRCCKLYSRVGVDFLKTSTGYAEKGASVEAVQADATASARGDPDQGFGGHPGCGLCEAADSGRVRTGWVAAPAWPL
jgi:deoxyribose-phosphate aldolase